jgi:hypothetical protein
MWTLRAIGTVGGVSDPDRPPVILGQQLADASAADERHTPPGPSPIAGIGYPPGSAEQWRWLDCPDQDAAMAEFVRGYVASDGATRATIRDCLGMDDLYTVLLYARRLAFAAIRTGDPAAVAASYDALSTVTPERIDWRDLSWAAWLAALAAVRTGQVPATVAAAAIGRAEPDAAEIMTEVVTSDECAEGEAAIAEACGVRVIATADGPVLLDADDEDEDVTATADLAAIGLAVARVLEREGTYLPSAPQLGSAINDVWVRDRDNPAVSAARAGLTGTVLIHAGAAPASGRNPFHHFLLVYVAEAATDADAERLRAGVEHEGPDAVITGITAGRLCAVLVARSAMSGEPSFEDRRGMERFAPLIRPLLEV